MLLSEGTQLSVMAFDHSDESFRTTSLHSFSAHDQVTLTRKEDRHGGARPLLRCDPQGRLCAMVFRSDFLALLPTKEHNLDELLQIDSIEDDTVKVSAPSLAYFALSTLRP